MPFSPALKTRVEAHEKSVVVNDRVLFPLTDPVAVAAILAEVVNVIEDRAFNAGVAHAQAEMRKALGVRGG